MKLDEYRGLIDDLHVSDEAIEKLIQTAYEKGAIKKSDLTDTTYNKLICPVVTKKPFLGYALTMAASLFIIVSCGFTLHLKYNQAVSASSASSEATQTITSSADNVQAPLDSENMVFPSREVDSPASSGDESTSQPESSEKETDLESATHEVWIDEDTGNCYQIPIDQLDCYHLQDGVLTLIEPYTVGKYENLGTVWKLYRMETEPFLSTFPDTNFPEWDTSAIGPDINVNYVIGKTDSHVYLITIQGTLPYDLKDQISKNNFFMLYDASKTVINNFLSDNDILENPNWEQLYDNLFFR